MERNWLLTWTCYGTWLAGASRGFVSNVRGDDGNAVIHNVPGTPYDENMPLLEAWMRERMKGEPISLHQRDAEAMIVQYQETARIRKWTLQAASVMFNHSHVILSASNDPDPQFLLDTLKSWATRALKKHREIPPNGTFWTSNGSKRKLADDEALLASVIYVVKKQPNPLAIYFDPIWQDALEHTSEC
jgi:REP element-mobilizing transposase RayT